MSPDAYRHHHEMPASHASAEQIVPLLLAVTGPIRSVVDVGGGDGGWLRVWQRHGATEVRLLDSPDAEPHLVIDRANFLPVDLRRGLPAPRRFDLALCLECAEHLPAERAAPLVDWLTRSAEIVVFSAAIPGQEGNGHINLRPPEYWRTLFQQRGFVRHDIVRPKIIHHPDVAWWYRQNLFLFASPSARLSVRADDFLPAEFHLIHQNVVNHYHYPGCRALLRHLGPALLSALRRRLLR